MKHSFFITIIFSFLLVNTGYSQDKEKSYLVSGIGFYNMENLFDTLIDPDPNKILQEEVTEIRHDVFSGRKHGTTTHTAH